MSFSLSFIFATRNRLSFLKITLQKLLDELQPDEEVVVVDGNSTDGSKEYLQQLLDQGKIHQFVSGPDKNQAHAWNKALLMAKGTIIKKIIDDDVFCYEAIRNCKNYMLENPAVDIVISNDFYSQLGDDSEIKPNSRLSQFNTWKSGAIHSFSFGDVHLLIRRSALAYIGLYNPGYVMMDWEYSLRISYLKANISYYTGYNALSVTHPQTVTSLRDEAFIGKQGKRAVVFYEYEDDYISRWSRIKIAIGEVIFNPKYNPYVKVDKMPPEESIPGMYDRYYDYIARINQTGSFTFIDAN